MVFSPVNRVEVMACGMSCRLPGCDNVNEFWDQLVSKVNLVTTNKSRWDPEYLGLPEKSGNLKDISKFDASFFGILPKQVNKMDPQLRLLLEVSYEAIVDAGFSPHELKGSNTGVYVASSYAEADFVNCGDMKAKDGYGVTGSFRTFQANRLSYYFDFKGPSYSLDAACSSGLVALHNAMQDILNGQCDYAVVGGVTVILRPQTTHGLNSLGVLARDGKCKTFDKSANGFVRSEAIVAVFLSKETLCRRVYAHLVNSVTNHCGFVQQGITYPSYEAQKDLLSRAYSAPGVSKDEVEFIETHGTGTDVGDPIETNAIHSILCDESRNQNPLLIGAVKSNIGHNECTAGLTSLLKVLMTINNEIIPPNLHFKTPNPKIKGLQDGTLKVVTEPTKFKGGLIGISSFGFGGTNAHAVVKPYRLSKQYIPCNIPSVLLSSGRTKQSVQENLTYMSAYTQDPEFHRLANQVANTPGDGMPFRGYKILSNQNDTTEIRKMDGGVSKQIWYILPGMGSDWPGMGKDLMILPVFQQTINRCHEYIANTDPEIDLLDLMMNSSKEKLDRTMAKFVTNTSIQVALVNCLKDLGIHPDGMIGFSMGEIACAYADSLLSEEQAVMAAYWRGRCVLDTSPPPGCMASVELGWDDVKARLPAGIVTACRNAENNTTISGDAETVDRFLSEIAAEGVFVRKVSTDGVAYHSAHMIPVAPLLRNKLNKIIPHQALRSKSWLSTSYPEELWETPEAKMLNTSYLVNNLVSPVLFYDAVRKIPPSAIVIEVAPHGSMKVLLQRTLHSDCDYLSLMSMKEPDNLHYFLSAVGKLFSFGISVDTSKLYPPIEYPVGTGISPLSPGIKWDHSTEWAVPSWEDFVLDGSGDRSTTSYEVDITENASDIFLKDHNVDGRILYPATGYIVLAWRAVASMLSVLPENLAIDLSDINIYRATIIREQKGNVTFKVRVSPAMNFFEISENNELTMSGKYNIPEVPFVPVDISQEVDESRMLLRQDDIYKEFRLIGYRYGPSFQGIKRSRLDGHQAYVEWNGNWITFLDSMLQVSILGRNNPSRSILLPTRILSIRINPLLHPSIDTKHREIPIKNDRVVSSCRSGGVEIVRLHTTMVQKRQVKQNPTLEYVQFVPYGENKIKVSAHVAHYGTICKQYLGRVLQNIASVYTNITLKSLQVTEEIKDIANDVSRYLNDNECGYIKVLHQFDQLKGSGDLVLDVLNVLDNNAVQLFQDKLLLGLLCDGSFKNLLDVILENSTTSKITAVEIGVRYGGMFSHIVPIFMSEPLYKLEFTATDRHVSSMSSTLKDQLRTFRVKLSQFDINKDNDIAFSSKGLVVVRGLAQQAECIRSALQKIHSILADGGFLLLYEVTSNFELYYGVDEIIYHFPRKDLKERKHCIYLMSSQWEEKLQSSGFEVIQQLSDSFSSTVFLCRKVEKVSKCVFIPVTGKEFDWVDDLKLALNEEQTKDGTIRKIWLIADGDYQSGIVGMINCLRKEDGGSNIRCIFNASDNVDLQEVQLEPSLMAELARKDLVMNVFKDGLWGSFRHCSLRKDNIYKETLNPRVYLNTLTRGDLSSLCWIESPTTNEATSSDHIPCTVYYSSLNFRDVMIASGKITADAVPEFIAHEECLIGYEFSGRDPAGKRVMGLVSSKGLATYVNAEPHFLFDVPDTWSLEDAATVPLIYSTVYYALIVRGQLRRGETVLIHSGSGGVGQAAITVALSYSCKIYTTVGTSEKRRFLMKKFPELTESSFANSHDLSFEEHVMRQTDGLGVNLILNSLSEEKFDASLRCLSTHGRFLEIGKYDISQNRKIGGSIFLKDTSFHGVVLTQLLERGNVEWPRVFDVMKKGIRSGVVQPISRTVFSPDEAEKAFRFMSQGKHIGKILIKVKAEETATTPLWKSISVKSTSSPQPNKVYVIIGGLGGFGLELADWLVARGCKKLVLTSRSGITTGYQSRCISRWKGRGVTVIVSGNDVSDSSACYQLLFDCQKMGPIGGIFNLALVLKDGLFENLTSDDFKAVCQPKTEIASNLDQATRQICGPELDWFVMFSSVTSGRGNAGQSNYGFGNSSMERICEERNKDNLPGIAIQWGVIGDVGRVVDTMNVNETEIAGCVSQTIESCLSTLDLFLVQPYPVLSTIVPADREKSISEDTSKIDMQNFVTKFFGIKDLSSLNQNITLAELGLDSLMGVEVKQTLERDFATIMSMKQIRSLTLGGLLNHFGRESSSNIGKTEDRSNSASEMTIPLRVSPILSSKETNCLVQLNTGQMQNSPVFLFHPLEGTIDVFRPLIPSLKDHPVYALTVNKEVPQDSIFRMATYYLSKMFSVQPDGPYNIAGYSFGALLALELVIYLQNEYNVAPQHNLMLIDASPDYVKSRFRKVLEEQMEDEHIQAFGLRDATNVQILVQFIQGFQQMELNESSFQLKQKLLAKDSYVEQLDLAAEILLKDFPDVDKEDMSFSVDSYVKRTWLLKDCKPQSTYRGNITLLKASSSSNVPNQERTNDYGLSKICTGEVKIFTIDGDHESIMQDPGVYDVAQRMKDLFSHGIPNTFPRDT